MKAKLLCVFIALCVLILPSCRVADDESVTGDVKEQGEIQSSDTAETPKTDSEIESVPSEMVEEKEPYFNDEKKADSVDEILKKLDAVKTEGGEYKADAERFCEAIMSKDAVTFAEFTGGLAEYYDFLEKVEIASYTLMPFEISPEVLEGHIYHGNYPAASDNYLVEFDVISSDCEEFDVGKCVYYAGFEINPLSGNLLSVFVPYDEAEQSVYVSYDTDYVSYFIDEFSALYLKNLYDGRNYPDSFDFSESSHLITHLMATSGIYGEPAYTIDEVNEFITESFDGNEGISRSIDFGEWTTAGRLYESDDPERIYGCSWGHGGISAEHKIIAVEDDGNSSIVAVEFYADYARIAKALCADFYFDRLENGLVKLTMVQIYDNTGREIALISA